MKSIAFTVLLLLIVDCCRAQIFSDWWKEHRYGIHAAYSWQGNSAMEIGGYRMWSANTLLQRRNEVWIYDPEAKKPRWSPYGFWSSGAAIEFPFVKGEFLVGPKLFTELNISLLSLSLNIASYTDFSRTDLRAVPGIGISLFGTLGIRYERNIVIGKTIFDSIFPNRLTVFINIIKADFPAY